MGSPRMTEAAAARQAFARTRPQTAANSEGVQRSRIDLPVAQCSAYGLPTETNQAFPGPALPQMELHHLEAHIAQPQQPFEAQRLTPGRTLGRRPITHRSQVEWQLEIKDAFETFDVDRQGSVDYRELKAAIRSLGLPARKADVYAAMREQGCPEGSRVDFDAFSRILMQRFREQDPLEATLKAFRLFDKSGRGRIDVGDLRRVSRQLKHPLTDTELQEMIERFDSSGEGEITESEFARIVASTGLWCS